MDYLSDHEKATLRAFLAKKEQVDVVQKVLLEKIVRHGTPNAHYENWILDVEDDVGNEEYGQRVRARKEAIIEIRNAFKRMRQVEQEANPPDNRNRAR